MRKGFNLFFRKWLIWSTPDLTIYKHPKWRIAITAQQRTPMFSTLYPEGDEEGRKWAIEELKDMIRDFEKGNIKVLKNGRLKIK